MGSDGGGSRFELASDTSDVAAYDDNLGNTAAAHIGLARSQAWNLYLSHALSTWNARGYEFATILFTAAAYPDTLTAAALRMIIVYFAMILLSSSVGHWVERSPDRLRTLLSTIVCNRSSVILGSVFWVLILSQEDLAGGEGAVFSLQANALVKGAGFAVTVAFGILERLSASGNLISMERDWVVVAAAPAGRPYDLAHLNAVMRRVDLVCKLLAPILVSAVVSALGSIRFGVVFTGLTSLVSMPIEIVSAKRVWNSSPLLRAPRQVPPPSPAAAHPQMNSRPSPAARIRQYFHSFEPYFGTVVWVPSAALALLHFNILTWRATFITYLISVGYSLNIITVARALGSLFEIGSTIITPHGIEYMGKAHHHHHHHAVPSSVVGANGGDGDESRVGLIADSHQDAAGGDEDYDGGGGDRDIQTLVGLQRFGLWGISWQLINTVPVVYALWAISTQRDEGGTVERAAPPRPPPDVAWSVVLFSFLAFSRLGVWVFDLTTQQLTQTLVPARQRSLFAGAEASVVNVFELLGAGAAIAFPHPGQYRGLALASLASVLAAWLMYAAWVRRRRGHLVHWEKLAGGLLTSPGRW
ncbi:hypothetical protein GGS23DRAFT_571444 [Durotheca rogersii]|uniref:uncharacterized protein n=1 Tax=Durotheca rogersii TaxID=419775 RepID=UPI00221F9201|nr:uncharacterized protein GGS23DRAFT_571444 [Durotheca rogersii]KAI5862711.1 hypothetical protein GGS23DRAFT_571444 [Durotheca rogersii]